MNTQRSGMYSVVKYLNLISVIFTTPIKFCTWVNTQKPTFKDVKKDHPRIIIPFIDNEGTWFGFQGRSLATDDKLRYITIMLDESKTKIFGLNRVDYNKTVYITEGPIDSFYIDNAIAMAGAMLIGLH